MRTPISASRMALSSSSFFTVRSTSPSWTVSPSATFTVSMVPLTSGFTTTEVTGLAAPEASTASVKSPRSTKVVMSWGASSPPAFPVNLETPHAMAPTSTIAPTMPPAISFLRLRARR